MKTENEVIARLIASTHKQKRPFSILEIANDIDWLSNHLGSLTAVAQLVSISAEMLTQFLRVKKLTPKAQALVHSRDIDSVAAVHSLAKFSPADQDDVIEELHQKRLSYTDIRLLSPLRKQFPQETISELVQRLKKSENIKLSVIQFPTEVLHRDLNDVKRDLSEIIGSAEVIDLALADGIGSVKITQKGEQALRRAARFHKKTLQAFTFDMLQ